MKPRLQRRASVRALVLAGAAALLAACGAREERLNLIVVSLDTCRADRLSCYGASRENTPALDAFAADAVRFDDCLAQSCVTGPSHMSLFTGQYPHRHGLLKNGDTIDPPATLAETLRGAGWRTAAFTGHGSLQARYGHGAGFEVFHSASGEALDTFQRPIADAAGEAEAWLDEHGSEPFFLFVHGYDPHCPYWPKEPWRTEYAGWYAGSFDPRGICYPNYFLQLIREGVVGEEEKRYLSDLYDGEVRGADAAIGTFLAGLEQRGLLERSVVVFLSDHGESLGKDDRIGHGDLDDGILRVPLVIRYPAAAGGPRPSGVRTEPVQLIDVAPTVLAALGVDAPPGVQGLDLGPFLRGEASGPAADRMRIAQAKDRVAVHLDGSWKIRFRVAEGTPEGIQLFDLATDPGEHHDLAPDPATGPRFIGLYREYRRFLGETREGDRVWGGTLLESQDPQADLQMLQALGYVGEEGEGDG